MTLAAGAVAGASHIAGSLANFQSDAIDSGNAKTLMAFVIVAALALFFQMCAIVGIAYVVFKLRSELMSHVGEIKGKIMPLVDKSHTLVNDLTPTIKSITVKAETLITDLTPTINNITAKVDTIAGHVEEISGVARDKVNEFGPTITKANEAALHALAITEETVATANHTARHALAMTQETVTHANDTARHAIADAGEKTRLQVSRFNGIVNDALDATVKVGKALEYGVSKPAREVAGFATGAKVAVEHLWKSYGSIFKGKPAPSAAPRRPVVAHTPAGMGSVPPAGVRKEYMDERDLDL